MKRPIQVFNFSVVNSASDTVDIHIDGEVVDASTQSIMEAWFGDTVSTSYKSFRDTITKQNANVYNVIINSPGGHVGDAMAIHDLLTDLQNKGKIVNTIGRGIVASSGTLILLAGKNPEMSANSWFMMHSVSGGIYGNVDQVERYANTLRKFNNSIRDLYVSKTGLSAEEVSNLMTAETWMTAQEASEKGFISNISGEVAFSNLIPKENWEYANTNVLNIYNSAVKPPTPVNNFEDMKQLFLDFKNTIINAIKGVPVVDNKIDGEALSTAIGNSFAELGDKIETEMNQSVTNALASEAGKTAISNAVTAAVAELNTKVTELTTQVENLVGEQSQAPGTKDQEKPIGGFA